MAKWKRGVLRSGGTGEPVRSQAQAVAIMLSEKRKAEAGNTEYQPDKEVVRAGMQRRAK